MHRTDNHSAAAAETGTSNLVVLMSNNEFLKQTLQTYNLILLEFDRSFSGMQTSYDSFSELHSEFDKNEFDYIVYSNPIIHFRYNLGELRRMKDFLIHNYPKLIESGEDTILKPFNILVYQTEELIERTENFLLYEPQIVNGSRESVKLTTAHFDMIACSSVKVLATITQLEQVCEVNSTVS